MADGELLLGGFAKSGQATEAGLRCRRHGSREVTQGQVGTVGYMAPEAGGTRLSMTA